MIEPITEETIIDHFMEHELCDSFLSEDLQTKLRQYLEFYKLDIRARTLRPGNYGLFLTDLQNKISSKDDKSEEKKLFDHLERITRLDMDRGPGFHTIFRVTYRKLLAQKSVEIWELLLNEAIDELMLDNKNGERKSGAHFDIYGVRKLKEHYEQFHEFEQMLYAESGIYRDHFLHQLTTFLLGSYLIHNFCRPREDDRSGFEHIRLYHCREDRKIAQRKAVLCIICLTHDLGYPIERVHKINASLRKMYEKYKNTEISEFLVNFPLAYQTLFNALIDYISISIEPLKIRNEPDGDAVYAAIDRERRYCTSLSGGECIQFKRNANTDQTDSQCRTRAELQFKPYVSANDRLLVNKLGTMQNLVPNYATALKNSDHGLISALLLFENLKMFTENQNVYIEHLDKVQCLDAGFPTLQQILKLICNHNLQHRSIADQRHSNFWFVLTDTISDAFKPSRFGTERIMDTVFDVAFEGSLAGLTLRYEYRVYPEGLRPRMQFMDYVKTFYPSLRMKDLAFTLIVVDELTGVKYQYNYQPEGEQTHEITITCTKCGEACLYEGEKVELSNVDVILKLTEETKTITLKCPYCGEKHI